MKVPQVTVLMPVFNGQDYLRAAIDSILNQTFKDLELLIIDDGSTDESRQVIHCYQDSRIRLIENGQNRGIVYTRNKGVEEAKGKFVANLDADDIAFPDRIAIQYRHFMENPELVLTGGHAEVIDANGEPTGEYYKMPFHPDEVSTELLFRNVFVNSTVMFKKEAILKTGGYRDFSPCEDYELAIRIHESYKVDNLDKIFVQYRVHGNNISTTKEALLKQGEEHIVRYMHQILGITPDDRLQKTHLSFIRHLPGFSPELMDYYRLFKEIKTANRKKKIFPGHLDKVLFLKWYEIIRQSRSRASLSLFFKKPLFDWYYTTPKMYRKVIKQALGFS